MCCNLEEEVVRMDPVSGKVTGKIPVAVGGGDVAMTFAEGSLWVSESLGNVFRVDPHTLRAVGPVDFERFPSALAVGEGALWLVEGDFGGDLSAVRLRDFAALVGESDARDPLPVWGLPVAILALTVLVAAAGLLGRRDRRPKPA